MMLDTSVLHARVLDHRGLDLGAARRVSYVLEQSFRYEYDAPVESLRQRLVIVPPARHGNQYLRAHRLEVTGAKVRRRVRRDVAGNVVAWLRAERVPEAIEFRLVAVLERIRDDGPAVLEAGALRSPRLLRPTPLTAADERLRAMAADIVRQTAGPAGATPRRPPSGSAPLSSGDHLRIRRHVGDDHGRRGAGRRARRLPGLRARDARAVPPLGLPARYVSGHLLGQGGTHAWVEVIVPRAGHAEAIAFDPCHGRRTDGGYVTVATGRDYSDVAPTSGSYVGTSPGRLTAGRRVGVLAAA